MIELREMTQLVDDDVVGDVRRKKDELVIKIEIAFCRTTPPA